MTRTQTLETADTWTGAAPGLSTAIEHLRRIQQQARTSETQPNRSLLAESQVAYLAIIRMISLDVVAQRFGASGLGDLRRAILGCLAKKLQPEDRMYDAANDTLLAVCDRRAQPVRQEQLTAELARILALNRDFPIQVGERKIMLRIPISFTVYAAASLGDPALLRSLLAGCACVPVPGTAMAVDAGSEMSNFALVPGVNPPDTSTEAEG